MGGQRRPKWRNQGEGLLSPILAYASILSSSFLLFDRVEGWKGTLRATAGQTNSIAADVWFLLGKTKNICLILLSSFVKIIIGVTNENFWVVKYCRGFLRVSAWYSYLGPQWLLEMRLKRGSHRIIHSRIPPWAGIFALSKFKVPSYMLLKT